MQWEAFLDRVRDLGRYTTAHHAEHVLEAVLAVLGSQLTGEERCDLAAALPVRARTALAAPIPLTQPVPAPAFVEAVARELDTTLAQARWDASAVLVALGGLVGDRLTDRLLTHLPRGYALLFGRADLVTTA
ncbi:DUF2267 domain-containing protein [Kitasatospora sp. NBC_01560]